MIREIDRKLATAAEQIEQAVNSLGQILVDKKHLDMEEVNGLYNQFTRLNGIIDLGFDHVRDFARIARAARKAIAEVIPADEVTH